MFSLHTVSGKDFLTVYINPFIRIGCVLWIWHILSWLGTRCLEYVYLRFNRKTCYCLTSPLDLHGNRYYKILGRTKSFPLRTFRFFGLTTETSSVLNLFRTCTKSTSFLFLHKTLLFTPSRVVTEICTYTSPLTGLNVVKICGRRVWGGWWWWAVWDEFLYFLRVRTDDVL